MTKTYFYAGYSTGFHHRSDAEAGALAHMAHNNKTHGERGRFVCKVEGSYFPPRANDKRGTLDAFLLANTVTAAAGTVLPTWVTDRQAAAKAAREAAKAAATEAAATAAAIVAQAAQAAEAAAATVSPAPSCGNIPTGIALLNRTAAEAAAAADVVDADGSAELVDAIETPDEAKRRRIEERAEKRKFRAQFNLR